MAIIKTMRNRSLLCAVLALMCLIVLSVGSNAQCKNWETDKYLLIKQRGALSSIGITFTSKGKTFAGSVEMSYIEKGFLGNPVTELKGNAEGSIDGDRINFKIFWDSGLVGVYTAKILPTGTLEGETYDKAKPSVIQTWHSTEALKCATLKSASAGILNKSTGKPKLPSGPKTFGPPPAPGGSTSSSRPSDTPATPMKVPWIVAGKVIYPDIRVPMGFVILQWDAGPDHQYAEIWFKVSNGDETFLVEQGKGSRQMPAERGKQYTYILTDANVKLGSVTFVAP